MERANTNMWMIRAGQDRHVLPHFLGKRIAYLGWGETGVIYPETTKQELKDRVERANPGYRGVGNATRCIWEFCQEVRIGDTVVAYDPLARLYHVGVVKSDAEYGTGIWVDPVTREEIEVPRYMRRIDWMTTVHRDRLSPAAQRYLGRPPTHFRLPAEISEEIIRLCR